MWKWLINNWERVFFSLVGLGLVGYSIFQVVLDHIANASIVFGLGFFSFIYANVSRFKKFKGLGFEAELWEDTKKEAENLLQRLRDVVTIYSREALLRKVYAGRWSDGADWHSNWKLYDDLTTQHDLLGQKIDLSDVKKTMDDIFLADMVMPIYQKMVRLLVNAHSQASKQISAEFGPTIRDNEGHSRRFQQLNTIEREIKDPYAVSKVDNLAQRVIDLWIKASTRHREDFNIDISIEDAELEKLRSISALYKGRPVIVTDEMIGWTNKTD